MKTKLIDQKQPAMNVLMFFLAAAGLIMLKPQPANAIEYFVEFSGSVATQQLFGSASNPEDVKIGDEINASFRFDTDAAEFGTSRLLLGGTQTIYNVELHDYSYTIGSQNFSKQSLNVALYLFDDVGGTDAFGFAYTEQLSDGPFNSDLLGTQFQARADGDMFDDTSISNGLPFLYPDWSLFASFRTIDSNYHFRGPLSVKVSEVTAVPEPAAWALMVFGFGAIGSTMRRQLKANVKASCA